MNQPPMNADERRFDELTFAVNGCAMDILNTIGHGFHEKIHENAMTVALQKRNIAFSQQEQFVVMYEKQNVGVFIPDLVINDCIIVELKTMSRITDHEIGQVMNYLKVSALHLGLILNFKHAKLEWKRVVNAL